MELCSKVNGLIENLGSRSSRSSNTHVTYCQLTQKSARNGEVPPVDFSYAAFRTTSHTRHSRTRFALLL